MKHFFLFLCAFIISVIGVTAYSNLKFKRNFFSVKSSAAESIETKQESIIVLTPKAQSHMKYLKRGEEALFLRMGVKSGGCSGMSYVMEFIKPEDITPEDHIEEYEGIKCVVDPKALLFLYGLKLGESKI